MSKLLYNFVTRLVQITTHRCLRTHNKLFKAHTYEYIFYFREKFSWNYKSINLVDLPDSEHCTSFS